MIPGEPHPHIPADWTTVDLNNDEVTAEAQSGRWHGRVEMDYIVLHMLGERGIRVTQTLDFCGPGGSREIEKPCVMLQRADGLTVHQGPRIAH